ncbi:MAG: hypothetical protein ACRDHP_19770, partial [Ktedonobacterales bacterium]
MILTSLLTDNSRAPLDLFSARTLRVHTAFPLHGATAPTPLSPARSTQMPKATGSLGAASAS